MIDRNAFMPIIGRIIGESQMNITINLLHALIGILIILLLLTNKDVKKDLHVKNVMAGNSFNIIQEITR